MFLQCQRAYDCRTLSDKTNHYHVCVSGHCVPEDKRRKRDITAQLIPAEGDGEIVPLVCERICRPISSQYRWFLLQMNLHMEITYCLRYVLLNKELYLIL